MNKLILIIFTMIFSMILSAQERSENIFHKAFEIANKKSVKIFGGTLGTEHGYASGVIISSDGLILTSLGMFLSSSKLRVTMFDGQDYPAKIVKRNRDLQTALLKIDFKCEDFFDITKPISIEQGDWVLAVGNPFKVADANEKMSLNLGVLSLRAKLEVKRKTQDVNYKADALIVDAITGNPGTVGGALVDLDGNLVGMIGKILEDKGTNTRMNYAVPVDLLKAFVESDGNGEIKSENNYIGIHLFMTNGDKAPAFIDRVDFFSPAFNSGLKKDDLLISIGPTRVSNCQDCLRVFKDLEAGESVNIVIKRGERFLSVTLKPETKKEALNKSDKETHEIDLELD